MILDEVMIYIGELGGVKEVLFDIEGKINKIYCFLFGVILLIFLFNFLMNLLMRMIVFLIVLGNSVVYKFDI